MEELPDVARLGPAAAVRPAVGCLEASDGHEPSPEPSHSDEPERDGRSGEPVRLAPDVRWRPGAICPALRPDQNPCNEPDHADHVHELRKVELRWREVAEETVGRIEADRHEHVQEEEHRPYHEGRVECVPRSSPLRDHGPDHDHGDDDGL